MAKFELVLLPSLFLFFFLEADEKEEDVSSSLASVAAPDASKEEEEEEEAANMVGCVVFGLLGTGCDKSTYTHMPCPYKNSLPAPPFAPLPPPLPPPPVLDGSKAMP